MIVAFQYTSTQTPYDFPDLEHFPEKPGNVSNPVTQEGVNLGRHLFYDPVLSKDSTKSCGTCHQQKKAFSGSSNKLGTKPDVPPLFNLAWHPSYGWGWYRSKFEKAFGEEKIDSTLVAKAIGQFLRTLLSYQSKFDKALRQETQLTQKAMKGFELLTSPIKGNCLHCHTIDHNPLGSDFKYRDIGLPDASSFEDYVDKGRGDITGKKQDFGQFKTPSLRNIVRTSPYMHDGRLKSLKDELGYSSVAKNDGIEGKVVLTFVVTKKVSRQI